MIERNFAQQILFLPISNGADELRIISGYSTPNMASWLIKNIQERHMEPISIKLILGMTPYNGISTEAHRGFIDLRHIIDKRNARQQIRRSFLLIDIWLCVFVFNTGKAF